MSVRVCRRVCVSVCVPVCVFYFENYFWLNERYKFLAVSPVLAAHLRHIVIAIWLLAIFVAKFFYYIQIKLWHPTPPPPPSLSLSLRSESRNCCFRLRAGVFLCVCVCVSATLDCDACLKVARGTFRHSTAATRNFKFI